MSTSETWTTYQISSVSYFDQTVTLTTQILPDLTDEQAFSIASNIAATLGIPLGSDVYVSKTVTTVVGYATDYTNGTFS